MADGERELIESRARRNAARAAFETRLASVRGAVERRSVAARLGDEALDRARTIAAQASSILGEFRWVAGLTAVGLFGWLLRRPLMRWSKAALAHLRLAGEPQSLGRRLREWTVRKARP